MGKYDGFSRDQLLAKIENLESLLESMKTEKNDQELLNFPWLGNLGSWYWNVPENELICNDQKVLSLGYKKEDIPEKIGFDFFTSRLHPEDYDRVMKNMRLHLYGNSSAYETTYRIKTLQGEWLWFYDRGKITKRNSAGKAEIVSGIVFDVTEQKIMEETLTRQNQRLVELSTVDFLTNVLNRRALYDQLDYEIRRVLRNKCPLSILLIDVDHFKQVNDRFGHVVGDKVLTGVAAYIKKTIRGTDIIGRFGGEEFLLLLPDCPLADGYQVAEKLRVGLEHSGFVEGVSVTISGGLAQFQKESIDQLIEKVDRLMYKAKQNGRNRIEMA